MTSSASPASPQHMGEIASLLDAGLGVEIAADVLDRLGDLARVAAARALERHMLEEMREPVLLARSCRDPAADEHADRGGAHMRLASVTTRSPEGRLVTRALKRRLAWATQVIGHRPAVVGQDDDRFPAPHQIGEALGQRRPHAGRALDRVGKFGGMGGRERDHRRRRRGASAVRAA